MPVHGWETSLGECVGDLVNVCPVTWIDKILSACCWLIPNRFAGQEVAAEACQALLGVMRICYENIAHISDNKSRFSWVLAMKLIRQVEVLYEMRATHLEILGTCNKYSPIAALELMKLFVRLFFLNSSQFRLTTTLTSSQQEISCKDPFLVTRAFRTLSQSIQPLRQSDWNSGIANLEEQVDNAVITANASISNLDTDCNDSNEEDYTSSEPWWDDSRHRVIQGCQDQQQEDTSSMTDNTKLRCRVGQAMLLIGEMLYLIRPVLCVFALRKYGPRSWKPWLLSLGIDFCSRFLLSKGESILKYAGVNRSTNQSIQDQLLNYLTMVRNFQWSPVEQKEMRRRKTLFLIYLLRSPLFDLVTKPGLDSAQKLASTLPVLGKVLGKALEILYGAQKYYVYTSGSW